MQSYINSLSTTFTYQHQVNLSMKCIPLKTPMSYSKTGVYKSILFFLFFTQNINCGYSLERVPNFNILGGNNMANIKKIKNDLCIMHGQVLIMVRNQRYIKMIDVNRTSF